MITRSESSAPTSRRTRRRTSTSAGSTGRIGGAEYTLVDYNRGGTPLVEIVTAPDIHSAEEAKRFLQLLRQTIVELGISDAEMEKGTLRVDANVSVRPAGSDELRTRCEIKNMNSFTHIARGIDAEVARQIGIWESGGTVEQHTYDFDVASGTLTARRTKEEADDYRYFPEPDLVPVEPPAELVERLRGELPELPAERIARVAGTLDHDRALVLVTGGLDALWQATVDAGAEPVAASNVIANQLVAAGVDASAVDAGELARLVEARERIPRGAFTEAMAKVGDAGFSADAVPGAGDGLGHERARADRRRGPGRQPRSGGAVPGRQGRAARVLRRPGDEGDEGPGRPAVGQRARAREARGVAGPRADGAPLRL